MVKEREVRGLPGLPALLTTLAVTGATIWMLVHNDGDYIALIVLGVFLLLCSFISLFGHVIVAPNESAVLLLFGKYNGTIKTDGWHYVFPFNTRKRISLRVRNFETDRLKVNDLDGNPVEIAAVIVWKVVETAEACFEVDDYVHYVHVQSESALRNMATHYPYDTDKEDQISLRGSTDAVAKKLREEVDNRLDTAGVDVLEARITHLAYAPEIASAMLQRQQASAIIAARQKIVEGAVGMVQMALDHLSRDEIVDLDEERKAAMVSNLLVVLCGDRAPQPIVNTGTLHN
ncbi:MAG: SPFH domain-containing protein [Planctomycetota bacterium]|jgi:regulator of protease activity HflC (stomatin/prohibitin superfamily)